MQNNRFNNIPKISKNDALDIVATPIYKINFSGDYYKAVFHLGSYPSEQTENALLDFIKLDYLELEYRIARRKAIEILAKFDCKKAIPIISGFLGNDDPYLVETVIWSLGELKCIDLNIVNQITSMLYKPIGNKRIVIQTLAKLGVSTEMDIIRSFSEDLNLENSVRGASIAALMKLNNDNSKFNELKNFLRLPNQNDRHCAVEDIINSGNILMLPPVLKAPVSPSFKIRAIDKMWCYEELIIHDLNLIDLLDSTILDNPIEIDTLGINNFNNDILFLIDQLFHTDFNRCYSAMKALGNFEPDTILYYLNNNWDRASKDYGAIYFFIISYKVLIQKGIYDKSIESKIDYLLSNKWPDYMKFRSPTILTWSYIDDPRFFKHFAKFADEELTPYWVNRYSALLSLDHRIKDYNTNLPKLFMSDTHRFVREKAKQIFSSVD